MFLLPWLALPVTNAALSLGACTNQSEWPHVWLYWGERYQGPTAKENASFLFVTVGMKICCFASN